MYGLGRLGVRAGYSSSISTLASPFSLPLTGRDESFGTQRCRARQGKRVLLCGGGRVTAGRLEHCRGYEAGNKVCVYVCVRERKTDSKVVGMSWRVLGASKCCAIRRMEGKAIFCMEKEKKKQKKEINNIR